VESKQWLPTKWDCNAAWKEWNNASVTNITTDEVLHWCSRRLPSCHAEAWIVDTLRVLRCDYTYVWLPTSYLPIIRRPLRVLDAYVKRTMTPTIPADWVRKMCRPVSHSGVYALNHFNFTFNFINIIFVKFFLPVQCRIY
jgi:hypothetical protein